MFLEPFLHSLRAWTALVVSCLFVFFFNQKLAAQAFEYPSYTYCKPLAAQSVEANILKGSSGTFSIQPAGQGVSINSQTGELTISPNAVIQDYVVTYSYNSPDVETTFSFTGDLTQSIQNGDLASGFGSQSSRIFLSNNSSNSAQRGIYEIAFSNGQAQLTKRSGLPVRIQGTETDYNLNTYIALSPPNSRFANRLYVSNIQGKVGYFDINTWQFYGVGRSSLNAQQLAFSSDGHLYHIALNKIRYIAESRIPTGNSSSFGYTLLSVGYKTNYNGEEIVRYDRGKITLDNSNRIYFAKKYGGESYIYRMSFNSRYQRYEGNERYLVSGTVAGMTIGEDGCLYYIKAGESQLRRLSQLNNCGIPMTASQTVSVTRSITSAEFSFPQTSYCNADATAAVSLSEGSSWGSVTSEPSGLVWSDISLGIVDILASEKKVYTITNAVTACGQSYSYEFTLELSGDPDFETSNVQACEGNTVNVNQLVDDFETENATIEFKVYGSRAQAEAGGTEGQVPNDAVQVGSWFVRGENRSNDCFKVLPVTVLGLPVPDIESITSQPAAACIGGTVDLNSVVYVSSISDQSNLTKLFFSDQELTQAVADPSAVAVAGTYWMSLRDELTGCTSSVPAGITVDIFSKDIVDFTYADFCAGTVGKPALGPRTVQGGTFTIRERGSSNSYNITVGQARIDRRTGFITGGVAGTTYEVRYSTVSSPNSRCPNNAVVTVLVQDVPNSGFSYSSGSYCQSGNNPLPMTTVSGGVFSATSPKGKELVINASTGLINLALSDVGSYKVSYTVSNTLCGSTSTVPMQITTSPETAFRYSESQVCMSRSNPILDPIFENGGGAGVFSAAPAGLSVNTSTGAVDLSKSDPGSYWVYNTVTAVSGCGESKDSVRLTVQGFPNISVQPLITYCRGTQAVDLAASQYYSGDLSNVSFTYYNRISGQKLVPQSGTVEVTEGEYLVIGAVQDGCDKQFNVEVMAIPDPEVTLLKQPSAVCLPETFDLTEVSLVVDYKDPSNPTGSLSYFGSRQDAQNSTNPIADPTNVPGSPGGTIYFIRATAGNGCYVITEINATAHPLDDPSFSFDDFCSAALNQATNIATPGGVFSFADQRGQVREDDEAIIDPNTGRITGGVPGTEYSVKYSTSQRTKDPANGVCPSSSVEQVTVLDQPNLVVNQPSPFCDTDQVNIADPAITAGSSSGLAFSYYGDLQNAIDGTNPLLSNNVGSGTYYIRAVNAAGCVGVKPLELESVKSPIFKVYAERAGICSDGSFTPTGNMAANYSSVEWQIVPGTGNGALTNESTLNYTYTPDPSDAGSTVELTGTLSPLPGCTTPNTVNVFISVFGPATVSVPSSTITVCESAKSVSLTGTLTNSSPYWTGGFGGSFENRSSLNTTYYFSAADYQNGGTTLTLNARPSSSRCQPVRATVRVIFEDTPDPNFSYSRSTYCSNETANPQPAGTPATGGTYSVVQAGLSVNPGTGELLIAGNSVAAGDYDVVYAIGSTANCPAVSDTVRVSVTNAPDAAFSYSKSSFCKSEGIIMPSIGMIGTISAEPAGLSFVAAGKGQIDLGASQPGQYVLTNSIQEGTCVATPQTFTLTVVNDPELVINNPGGICEGASADLTDEDITAGTPNRSLLTFSYYLSEESAEQGEALDLVSNPQAVGGGDYYIRAVRSTDQCASVGNVTVSETENPVYSLNIPDAACSPQTIDVSGTVQSSQALRAFYYLSKSGAEQKTADSLTVSQYTQVADSGYIYLRIENRIGCDEIDSVLAEINSLDNASFEFDDFCFGAENQARNIATPGGEFSLVGTVSGSATINGTTGHIADPVEGSTYQVRYMTNKRCPNGSVVKVMVKPLDNASFEFDDFCFDDGTVARGPSSVLLSGGAFSLAPHTTQAVINPSTGEITDYSAGVSYGVTYNTAGSPEGECPNSLTKTVTVLSNPDTRFEIPRFCPDNPLPAVVYGMLGGEFSFAVSPGDKAIIDPVTGAISGATPDWKYKVSYSLTNVCEATSYYTVQSLPLADAGFQFPDFCVGTLNGPTDINTPGGIFSLDGNPSGVTIDPATGRILGAVADSAYQVRYTLVSDQNSCENSLVHRVRVNRIFVSGPSNIVINQTDKGKCSAQVFWTEPVLNGLCEDLIVSSNFRPGDEFPVGITKVTYEANLNELIPFATYSFTVQVIDNAPPVIADCETTKTFRANEQLQFQIPDLKFARDNCKIRAITQEPAAGTQVGLGAYLVTVMAEDVVGKQSSCEIQVNVLAPAGFNVTCLDPIQVMADENCRKTVPDLESEFRRLNSVLVNVTQSPAAGTSLGVGRHEITLTAETVERFSCTVPFTVVTQPDPVCQNAVIYLDINGHADIDPLGLNNGSMNPCGTPDQLSFRVNKELYHCADLGANPVVLTVENQWGVTAACDAIVTVMDTISPIAVTRDVDLYLDSTGGALLEPYTIDNNSHDNCGGRVELSVDRNIFRCDDIGEHQAILTVRDESGKVARASAEVAIIDSIKPRITCPPDVELIVGVDSINYIYNLIDQLRPEDVIENCSVQEMLQIPAFRTPINHGDNPVYLVAIDQSGNEGRCVTNIRLNRSDIDFPSEITVNVSPTTCQEAVPDFAQQLVSRNPGVTNVTQFPAAGTMLDVGKYRVILEGTDSNGLWFNLLINLTVIDRNPPQAVCRDLTVYLNNSGVASITPSQINNGSSDLCSPDLTYSLDRTMFTCNELGNNHVVLTVTDGYGNNASCGAAVTVKPTGNSVLSGCPTDITVNNDPGECGAAVSWIPPVLDVSCGTITSNYSPGDFFPIDTTEVIYVARAGQDVDTCRFNIIVRDAEPPLLQCSDVTACAQEVTVPAPSVLNNCPVVSLTNDFNGTGNASGTYPIGTTVVNWTVEDSKGRRGYCRMEVRVPPAITISLNPVDSIFQGSSVQLEPRVTGANRFRWAPAAGLNDPNIENPIASPAQTTQYVFFAWRDGFANCTQEAMVKVVVIEELEIPDVFTPNGDGINDFFEVKGVNVYPEARMRIYNELGDILFESNAGYTNLWDGTNRGKKLVSKSYYWVLELNDDRNTNLTGIITIIR
ncbi:MAG: HYR domain-containing protein [Cytophagales bacterium]|nr:HYR domain-containing protein [Cytophagales bacterium]